MIVEIEKTIKEKKDIRYFCLDVLPRYWEDSDINGEEDIEWETQNKGTAPRMPLSYRNSETRTNYQHEWYSWKIKVDIETGKILDWIEGTEANIYYKVCDAGTYWLETIDGEEVHKIDSYVPKVIDFYGNSYGVCLIFNINKDGYIKEWIKNKEEIFINNFLKEKDF